MEPSRAAMAVLQDGRPRDHRTRKLASGIRSSSCAGHGIAAEMARKLDWVVVSSSHPAHSPG
eukprot:5675827-Alexandrium_andersonii.AAC.1